MWKRAGITFITIAALMTAMMFRVYYVAFGDISTKTRSVAGGRTVKLDVYNSKGIIYDRNVCALSGNQFVYYLVINPRGFDRSKTEYICELTDTDTETLNNKLNRETVFTLQSYYRPEKVDGVYVYEGTSRYPETPTATHLLGYLDSEGQAGLSGIEKSFDSELSAYSAKASVSYSANAVRGVIAGLGINVDRTADDTLNGIILTIDKNLSLAVDESMSKHIENGCAVVMNCENGEILAMSSKPDFDRTDIAKYIDSDNGELINNTTVNQTVGSVFKMLVSACAIRNGLEDFTFECSGGIDVSGRVFSCQNKNGHGYMVLKEAFSQSCNSYFIALGQLLGYDKLIDTAQLFGIDNKIELCKNMYTSSGILTDNTGTQSVANMSIGQGELMMSPVAVARMTAVLCNGGYLLNPTVYYGTYIDGCISNKSSYVYRSQILDSETAEKLREMSVYCVTDGTGINAMPEEGGAGGKTASAQTGVIGTDGNEILNTYFSGFYPADNPKYVITVFAADGDSGSRTCAPVFREICDFISQNY